MAISQATELKILVKTAGENNLDRLSRSLGNIGKNTVDTNFKFDKFSRSLLRTEQTSAKSINTLKSYAASWREVANSVDITSAQFKKATAEAERLEKAVSQAQGRRGRGRLAQGAQIAGAVGAAGIFGGPEGALGAGIGAIVGGPLGAATGGAIGAQVGQIRQALGATADYAAGLQKQRLALQLVTKDADEYQRALKFISTTSKNLAIPQDILTRQFTKLSASVIGAGGDIAETEIAFKGIAAGIRGTGGDLQDLDSALTATAQVFSKGKVSAEELRQQIGERLPGAFTLFAESLGKTPAELDKALELGKVSLQDFQTFAVKLFKEYGASAEIIAQSPAAAGDRLKTALSNLSNSVGTLLQPIGAAFQSTFADIANAIAGAANALNEFFGIAGGAKLRKLNETINKEVQDLTELKAKRDKRLADLTITEEAKGLLPDTTFLDRAIRQGEARLQKLTDEYYSLQAVDRAIASGQRDKPKGLPSVDLSGGDKGKGREAKPRSLSQELLDLSRQRNEADRAGLEIEALKFDFLYKEQQIREQLAAKTIDRNTALQMSDNNRLALEKAIGQKLSDIPDLYRKAVEEQNKLNVSIEDQAIKLGVIDEKEAKILMATRELQELEPLRNLLSGDKLALFDKVVEKLNEIKNGATGFGQELGESFQEGIKTMGELSQNLGSALAGAFGGLSDQLADFITTGKASFAEFTQSVLQDLARIFVRFAMFNALKGVFEGTGFLGFADGGIMTANGPMDLKRYARGGIANSPQLAMFGEGSTPEAYVPLPDGRSIPVTMKGAGNGTNVVVNVDAKGTGIQGDQPNGAALGRAIGAAVQAELIKQRRPGGLLA